MQQKRLAFKYLKKSKNSKYFCVQAKIKNQILKKKKMAGWHDFKKAGATPKPVRHQNQGNPRKKTNKF